jgi:hypothetical protein
VRQESGGSLLTVAEAVNGFADLNMR